MDRYIRRVFRITGYQSPNVRLALKEKEMGKEPSHRIIIDGVLPYADLQQRLQTWDPVRIRVGVDALFDESDAYMLYPMAWLDRANRIGDQLEAQGKNVQGEAIGVDPGEGVADTGISVVNKKGLLECVGVKTKDTSRIIDKVTDLAYKYQVPDDCIMFDRGGGGLQLADFMRRKGWNVLTVGFGESPVAPLKRGVTLFADKIESREDRTTYKNRRAQMYGEVRTLIDPINEDGFGIPSRFMELRSQLAPIPLLYDEREMLYIPPKSRRPGNKSSEMTMIELIGKSPDLADSFVVAVHCLLHGDTKHRAGTL